MAPGFGALVIIHVWIELSLYVVKFLVCHCPTTLKEAATRANGFFPYIFNDSFDWRQVADSLFSFINYQASLGSLLFVRRCSFIIIQSGGL
jgi:hypothetical protein